MWIEVKIKAPQTLQDGITNRLFELGAQAVSEEPEHLLAYYPIEQKNEIELQLANYTKSLHEIFPAIPICRFIINGVKEFNWVDEWKKFYKAQKLSKRFYLIPAWDNKTEVPKSMIPIRMVPDQAFGTGLHPSTRLCIELMEKMMDLHTPHGIRMVDIGTGSGILSIVGKKLGIREITALDIDLVALGVARKNIAFNECEGISVIEGSIDRLTDSAELIVSNILSETHQALASQYAGLLTNAGFLILSGILVNEISQLEKVFVPIGFKIINECRSAEWAALQLQKISS